MGDNPKQEANILAQDELASTEIYQRGMKVIEGTKICL